MSAGLASCGIGSGGYPQGVIQHSGKRHRNVTART
jgi:hypothetical protein